VDLLAWVFVGLIAGYGASCIHRASLGVVGDVLVGLAGAVSSGVFVQQFEIRIPVRGLGGVMLVALAGSVALSATVRLFKSIMK
jgi:uncharacterized membrane protein YeaQ/YmgE (transglycosylase-associated protein family)